MTDCLLRSFYDLKQQTQLHYVGWVKNKNKLNRFRCHYLLITLVKSILLLTYLFSGFSNRNQGFFDDASVPFEDYLIPERRPTYSNQRPLPPAPNTYPDSDYDPTLLDPAPNTYPDSDYDPNLLDSYSEEKVDGRSFRQGHSPRSIIPRSFRQGHSPRSIIPDPVIIPTIQNRNFFRGLFKLFIVNYHFVQWVNLNLGSRQRVYRKRNDGKITSPGFPKNYDSNLDLKWLIQAPPGHVIEISFLSFDLEKHSNCKWDRS